MITRQGQVKLADFGLARALDAVQLTQTGTLLGSPAYMAPELCRGEEPGPAADIYSLGCSLFQVLTGTLPYPGSSSLQLIHRHIGDPLPRLASQRPELAPLDHLIQACLAKDADQRPTADQLSALLVAARESVSDDLQAGTLTPDGPATSPAAPTVVSQVAPSAPAAPTILSTPTARTARGIRWRLALAVVVLLCAAGLAVLVATRRRTAEAQPVASNPAVNDLRQRTQTSLEACAALARRGEIAAARRNLAAVHAVVPELLGSPEADAVAQLIEEAAEAQQRAAEADLARVAGDLAGGFIQEADERLESLRPVIERELPDLQLELDHLAAQLAPTLASQPRSVVALIPADCPVATPAQLPWSAPLLSQPARLSRHEQGRQVLRLDLPATDNGERRGGVLLWLGAHSPARMTIQLSGPGLRRKIAGFALPDAGWEAFAVPFAPGDGEATQLELTADLPAPFVLAAALYASAGLPRADALPGTPGTLLPWQPRPLDGTWAERGPALRRLANPTWLVPQRIMTLKPALAKALSDITATAALPGRATVAVFAEDDLADALGRVAGRSPLLLYHATAAEPGPDLAEIRRTAADLLARGTLMVLVAGAECAGTGLRPAWQRALLDLRQARETTPGFALPVIDLGAVPQFYELNDVPLDRQGQAWQARIAQGLEAGLRQLDQYLGQ
jgi:hypothetical protein